MAIKFIPPDFVENNSPELIQQRMMEMLPADIDNMPGGFPWDFTMPTAIEKSRLIQYNLVRALMVMFPMWAWGDYLDLHGKEAGLTRKEAGYASGDLYIVGIPGTVIPVSTVFATEATNEKSSVEFVPLHDYLIPENGEIEIDIVAKVAGKDSNVLAGTITMLLKPIKGIISISNHANITGGTEKEEDEAFRERIQEANESVGSSYVGNDSDYIRWAKEIIGTGKVAVIPEWDGAGTVKLVILDANGQPANDLILEEVYNYIMSPNDRLKRKAPIETRLTVVAPDIINITYKGNIILLSGYDKEKVIEQFKANLLDYYEEAKEEEVLRYTKLASVLSETEGIADYTDFVVNDGTLNINIAQDEYPETGVIEFVILEGVI